MKKIGIMSRFFHVIQSTPNLRNNVEFLAFCVINTQKIKNYSKKELLWLRMDENQMDEFDNIRLEFLGWTNRDGFLQECCVSGFHCSTPCKHEVVFLKTFLCSRFVLRLSLLPTVLPSA